MSPVFLFAREKQSLKELSRFNFPPVVDVGIDHDLAFRLNQSELIETWRETSTNEHILIVERQDIEFPTAAPQKAYPLPRLRAALPQEYRRIAKRLINRMKAAQRQDSAFAKSMLLVLRDKWPEIREHKIVAADISNPDIADFKTFCNLIRRSEAVATNRLHVGILGNSWE